MVIPEGAKRIGISHDVSADIFVGDILNGVSLLRSRPLVSSS